MRRTIRHNEGMLQVSLVVPTFNRASRLVRCLAALDRQDLEPHAFEVLVVNDGSTDDTSTRLEGLETKLYDLRVLEQGNRGPAAARNLGIQSARADLVAFLDDDCEPETGWLRALVGHMLAAPPDVAGCGGLTLAAEDGLVPRYIDRIGVLCPRVDGEVVLYLITCNAIFRRAALVATNGFDESYRAAGGEDPELCARLRDLGHRFSIEPRARMRHRHPTTWRGLYRMYTRYARGVVVANRNHHGWREPPAPYRGYAFLRHFVWPDGKWIDVPGYLACEVVKIAAVAKELGMARFRWPAKQ